VRRYESIVVEIQLLNFMEMILAGVLFGLMLLWICEDAMGKKK
jgi:hypothetical protein